MQFDNDEITRVHDCLSKAIDMAGVQSGDILYVASDMMWFFFKCMKAGVVQYVEYATNLVLDVLKEHVGPKGTLLIPTYNWDFCQGLDFDYKNSNGQVGYLGTRALHCSDFQRTRHPIYSFAVYGKHSEYLVNLRNIDSWGGDSPFAFLQHQYEKAKFLSLGIRNEFEGFTFLHYVEEMHGVPWRYLKNFTAGYIDGNGHREERTYSMYVRDLELGLRTGSKEEFFVRNGVMRVFDHDGLKIKLMKFSDAYDVIWNDIEQNEAKGILV